MATSHTRAVASAGLSTRMSTTGNADMSAFAHSLTHLGRAIAFAGLSSILMGAAVTLGPGTAWAGEASPQSLASKEVEKTPALASKEAKRSQSLEANKKAKASASELKKAETESALEAKPAPKQGKSVNQMVQRAAMEVRAPKPAPPQTPAAQTTELKVSLCWETMNGDNKKGLVKGDSDFGQLNFENWDFGSTLDSSRKDVKDAFGKIQFQIKDITDNKVVKTTAGTYDPDTATSATKSLGSYDSTHKYEVSVVNNTIPSPYYVTYNNVEANESAVFEDDASYFIWTPSKAKDKKSHNKYFRLNVLEIVYAKDESVADKCFSYEQPKKADSSYRSDGNWNFSYNKENIFAHLRVKDNKIQFPKTDPIKPGFKFVGWQFYVAQKKNGRPYTSYDRMGDDDKKIINAASVAYVPFNEQTTTHPYLFAVLRDNKGVNTFGSKLGTQYCSTNHTFVVFPKWEAAGYKVTFMNGDAQLAQVKVQENKAIDTDGWTDQSMPNDPTKDGYVFKEWNTDPTGEDKSGVFNGMTIVNKDTTVYAQFRKKETPTPTPGPYYPLPEPAPVPDVPAPAPTPEPEHKVPVIEAPAPAVPVTPTTPASAPKHTRTLPQTGDLTLLSSLAALPVALGACLGAGAALVMGGRSRARRRHSARR